MFQKLNTKQKEYLLILTSVLLLFLSYELAIKKSIEQWQINIKLKDNITNSADLTLQPEYLKRKVDNQKKIFELYQIDSAQFRSNVISTVSVLAEKENVKLLEVPADDPAFHTDRFIIQKLVFQGSYFSLIKTLKQLQGYPGTGVIRSVALKLALRGQSTELSQPIMEVYFLYAR